MLDPSLQNPSIPSVAGQSALGAGTLIARERENWIRSLSAQGSSETLFQIEALLIAVDRFCRPGELSLLGAGLGKEGLKNEMQLAVRTVQRALGLCRHLLDNRDTSAILFDRFVEESLLQDGTRDRYWVLRFEQESPRDSFSLLDGTLEHLVYLGNGLLQGPAVGAPVLRSYAILLKSALYANKFFNPFISRGFSELYDRIDHPLIIRAVESAEGESVRRSLGLMILGIMRLLRYLALIQPRSLDFQTLRDSLPLFALLRSDMLAMTPVLEHKIPELLQATGTSPHAAALSMLGDSLAFQFQLEGHKVFDQILNAAVDHTHRENLLSAVETAHGILINFLQQAAVAVIQAVVPSVRGRDLFNDFVSRQEQSIRLREDVWILHQIILLTTRSVRFTRELRQGLDPVLIRGLSDYLDYFQSFAMKNIRAGDLPTFQDCCSSLRAGSKADLLQDEICTRFEQELHKYQVFLETVLQQVHQRTDLRDIHFDEHHSREILHQFIPQGDRP